MTSGDAAMIARPYSLDDTPFSGATGRGITIAVVDSGVHVSHPHVRGAMVGGHSLVPDGDPSDFTDRLGHGTAVAAAIAEKAPDASLLVIKVFDRTLATSAEVLALAIVDAAERGARLINLSLGTPNMARAHLLGDAVADASERGAIVVSAYMVGDSPWLPGALPDVAGVVLDWQRPRDSMEMRVGARGTTTFAASGYPRPIPGVAPARNLSGISFAVANVTGFLARLLESDPALRHLADIERRLS